MLDHLPIGVGAKPGCDGVVHEEKVRLVERLIDRVQAFAVDGQRRIALTGSGGAKETGGEKKQRQFGTWG